MAKVSRPQSSDDVKQIMKEYISKKKFTFSEMTIEYMAEACFLHFSSKDWAGVSYWPAVAMKWVLNNATKFGCQPMRVEEKPKQGETLRDKILKEQQE